MQISAGRISKTFGGGLVLLFLKVFLTKRHNILSKPCLYCFKFLEVAVQRNAISRCSLFFYEVELFPRFKQCLTDRVNLPSNFIILLNFLGGLFVNSYSIERRGLLNS